MTNGNLDEPAVDQKVRHMGVEFLAGLRQAHSLRGFGRHGEAVGAIPPGSGPAVAGFVSLGVASGGRLPSETRTRYRCAVCSDAALHGIERPLNAIDELLNDKTSGTWTPIGS
jgi:hypothetical protein